MGLSVSQLDLELAFSAEYLTEWLTTSVEVTTWSLSCESNTWRDGTSKNVYKTLDIIKEASLPYWWRAGWIVDLLLSMLVLMSTLYHSTVVKLKSAESKIKQLTALLQTRNEKLRSLVMTIDKLKGVTEENERRLELQRNELEEQYAVLQEMLVLLKELGISTVGGAYLHAKEMSREFWILRKYRPSLVVVTKPYIHQIIRECVKAGLVSEKFCQCACVTGCPSSQHDCTDQFYKALQLKVSEAPHSLESFLLLMKEKVPVSKGCQQLCNTMMEEMQAAK